MPFYIDPFIFILLKTKNPTRVLQVSIYMFLRPSFSACIDFA